MRRAFGILVAVGLAAAGCTSDPEQGGSEASTTAVNQETAEFGALLWQIRGHHVVSLELFEGGDTDGAATHAGHPIHEILGLVEPQVRERDAAAADTLSEALENGSNTVVDGSAEELEEAYDQALVALEDAEQAVVGATREDPAYVGSVIAGLAQTAAAEYGEALIEGAVTELVEYQDAYAFLTVGRTLYDEVEGDVSAASEEDAAEIEEAQGQLEQAFPSATPPEAPATIEDVEADISVIAHELEETIGAVVAEDREPEEVFARIDELLEEILTVYEEGQGDVAAELAAEAYLENYEIVEAEVIALAPEVNDELEPLLGAQIRAAIQDGVAQTEVQELVDQARSLLDQAEQAVVAG